ncbi:ferredoxin [Streptomyces ficellus]|uniref:Ferredoxin n=1 Tax=Streptomyces ficellus TaxID=1977088 RepID=A0A6I6FJ55_9ACTN|nr:ferredoxin [Streptomyces ficellus]QGV77548.1 ferredoxin [Streptomyces ficellus]
MSAPHLSVDRERCIGAGMCAMTAPEVFDQDPDEGLVLLLHTDPPAPHDTAARMAAGVCPAGAITVHDPRDDSL